MRKGGSDVEKRREGREGGRQRYEWREGFGGWRERWRMDGLVD